METRIPVRFKKLCPPYNPLDVAGFPPERSLELVQQGIAEYFRKEDVPADFETAPGMSVPIFEWESLSTRELKDKALEIGVDTVGLSRVKLLAAIHERLASSAEAAKVSALAFSRGRQ